MAFMSLMLYVTFNPKIIFDRYKEYDEAKHLESFNYRMKSNRSVQLILNEILDDVGGSRCYVLEMHNGKANSTGLSFNYGSLTYEVTRDSVESVREDYSDFSLERYPLAFWVYENGYWCGTVDDLMKIDRKLALKFEANDTYAAIATTIYGIKSEIGFVGVSFGPEFENLDKATILNKLRKYANQISPFLDGDYIGLNN